MHTETELPPSNEQQKQLAEAIRDPLFEESRLYGKPFGYPPRTAEQLRLDMVEYKTRVIATGIKQTLRLLLTPLRLVVWSFKNINDIMFAAISIWLLGMIGLIIFLGIKAYAL